eukprot:m.61247 g.61247  ORF g.61247 m.61247 type:complete len:903 (+) comp7329_c2_seq1:2-2710(+)
MDRRRKARAADAGTREPVQVSLRLRPLTAEEAKSGETCVSVESPTSIDYHSGKKSVNYTFSRVFDQQSTQEEVFEATTKPLVEDLLAGKNALLFTYGSTGSGKTFTMQGDGTEAGLLSKSLDIVFNSIRQAKWYSFKPDDRGNIVTQTAAAARAQRAQFKDGGGDVSLMNMSQCERATLSRRVSYDKTALSNKMLNDPDARYAVFVSYVEMYNENFYDLLDEEPLRKQDDGWKASDHKPNRITKSSKRLISNNDGMMYVGGITEVEVHSTEEAYDLLHRGQQLRQVAATDLNAHSSRSHSIFTVRLVRSVLDEEGKDVLRSKTYHPHVSQFSLVDLAGSERTSRTGSKGTRRQEAGQINKSLMVLRQCMQKMRENQRKGKSHPVPFRNSNLTKLFSTFMDDSHSGKVAMVVCISPSASDKSETHHVLEFSALAQSITTSASAPAPEPPTGLTPGRGNAHKRKLLAITEEDSEASSAPDSPAGCRHNSLEDSEEEEEMGEEDPDEEFDDNVKSHTSTPASSTKRMRRDQSPAEAHSTSFEALRSKLSGRLHDQQAAVQKKQASFREMLVEIEKTVASQSKSISQLTEELQSTQHSLLKAQEKRSQLEASNEELHSELAAALAEIRRLKEEEEALVSHQEKIKKQYEEEVASKAKEAEKLARLAREKEEKENLAVAEMNRKEQEWRKRYGHTEEAKEAIEKKLARVREVLKATSDKRKRRQRDRRASSVSPARVRAAASHHSDEEDEYSDDEEHDGLATQNPEPCQEKTAHENAKAKAKKHRRRSSAPFVLNHRPDDIVDTDTIMTPVLKGHSRTVSSPTIDQLVSKKGKPKTSKYILNHQERAGEHEIYKADIERSVTNSGVSVRFTEVEKLSTEPAMSPLVDRKRKAPPGSAIAKRTRSRHQ